MHTQSKLLQHTPVMVTHSSYELDCVLGSRLVVTILVVFEKEEGVVGLHLPIGSLKKKKPLWVEAGTEMRNQYLPAH